jgi:hypothetical protein
MNVADLRSGIQSRVDSNPTAYAGSSNTTLQAYFEKVGAPRSPVKKSIAEKVSDLVKSDSEDAAPVVKKRRKTVTASAEE